MNRKSRVTIIAEIGNSHEGSLGLAKCFIRVAADCGVDIVKFQTHIFEAESLPSAPNPPYFSRETRKEYFERTAFSLAQWKELKDYAEEVCGVEFLSSPFSLEAVELLEKVGVSAYKVPSGEVSNQPLLIKIASTKKKVFLSSGMSTMTELDEAVDILQKNGCCGIIILQCTSKYPCPPENAGLNVLEELRNRYNLPVGFSDHTLGIAIPIAAVCLGACVIEKHFTLSRAMYGSDAKNATEPDEFKCMVDEIHSVEKALKSHIDKDEIARTLVEMKRIFEKSIVAASDLPRGTILEEKHLTYKKPGDGIPARMFRQVIGKELVQDISKNSKVEWVMLK